MINCYKQAPIRVIIVDDHELTRFSLKILLSKQKDIQLVALASNGQQALTLCQQYHPDVVLLDLQMPVMNGFVTAEHIKQIAHNIQIIAYSSYIESNHPENYPEYPNIDVFCPKEIDTNQLIELIHQSGNKSSLELKI